MINTVQQAYIQGISTRKLEDLVKAIGLDGISKSQVSEMTKLLSDEVEQYRNCAIEKLSPILAVDALYEKVRDNDKFVNSEQRTICKELGIDSIQTTRDASHLV